MCLLDSDGGIVGCDPVPVGLGLSSGNGERQVLGLRPIVEFESFGVGDRIELVFTSKLDGSEVRRQSVELL